MTVPENHAEELHELHVQNRLLLRLNQALEQDELLDAALQEVMTLAKAPSGAIGIMDPRTGKVMAHREHNADLSDLLAAWEEGDPSVLEPSVIAQQGNLFIEDISEEGTFASTPPDMAFLAEIGFRSVAALCLPTQSRIVGYIMLLYATPRTFSPTERALLETIAGQIGIGVQRVQIYQRERQERHLSETLHETSEIVSSTLELDQVLPLILEQLASVIPHDRACITMVTDGVPQMVAISGSEDVLPPPASLDGKTPSEQTMEAGEPLIADDALDQASAPPSDQDGQSQQVRSWLGAPMWHQGEVSGAILLESFHPHNFHPEDAQVLATFASQASIAIINAQLFKLVARGKQAWEETFDAIEDGISVHDRDCRMMRVNEALAKLLGSTPQALVDQRCYRWHQCHESPAAYCPHEQLLATGEAQSTEFGDGGRRFHLSVYPLGDAEGKIVGSVHSIKDVTEQRQLQKQLLQAEKLSAIGELVAGVAHELNNPLTTILGYAQLLVQDDDLDVSVRDDLSRVTREALRSRRIVENLLTFARKHEPEKSSIVINELIEHTVEMRAYQLRVDNIEVALQLYRPLPRTMADQYQLQQLFLNLVNNAHHAMKEAHGGGRLLIRTSLLTDERAGQQATRTDASGQPRILIETKDTGPGIEHDVMAKIFDPFFTTKKTGQGTGLGLSICYGIVQEHDGRIWAESTPGEGATFLIELPVLGSRTVPDSRVEDARLEPTQSKHRILVVDDEEGVVSLLLRLLKRDDHYVEGARGGREALDKLTEQPFDLIISDVKMPGVSGQKLHQEIRQRYPDLVNRMIFLSGDTISLETRAFLEATGNLFLRKPFSISELKQAVSETLKE